MKSIAFFNNKGGVGKTTLVYHTAFMFAELGYRVLAVDLDPQSNLSSMALDESKLEDFWSGDDHPKTLYGAVQPRFEALEAMRPAHIEELAPNLGLLIGDLALSSVEDKLSVAWSNPEDLRYIKDTTALWSAIDDAARRHRADVVLIDVGPNLGAINRATLLASTHVVMPVVPDLFSLQGLKNLGPALRKWRDAWQKKAIPSIPASFGRNVPQGQMEPIGYVLMQHAERKDRPIKAYKKWQERLPSAYRESVLNKTPQEREAGADPNQIDLIKHYRSLMPMAMSARKPMFSLKAADGAIGGHLYSAQKCGEDFERLVLEIARRAGIEKGQE